MQSYTEIPSGKTLRDSRALFLDNDKTIASHYAGTNFPTENLIIGMECYRTDLNVKYRLESLSPVKWEPVLKASEVAKVKVNNAVNADRAIAADSCIGNAATATKAKTADSCTGNAATATRALTAEMAEKCSGNAATATKLQTTRTINGVAFDGSKNIAIALGLDANSNIAVLGSTVPTWDGGTIWTSGNCFGGVSGRRSASITMNGLSMLAGISAGTYTLQNLLQQLVTRSHTHNTKQSTAAITQDCNCVCSTDSDSDN